MTAVDTRQVEATVFNMRTPALSKGRTTDLRAATDLMTVFVKVYAEGGENAMHTHPTEDHTFVVLQGEATFRLGTDANQVVLHPNEGVLLPRGSYYWFQSSGDENLVMIRVGACTSGSMSDRLDPEGRELAAESAANKHVNGVPIPGKFFGV